ncbi:MAG: energy transducer TonB [Alphaproteobacteria bacterium]|nr:energy transducer TonB [Alphaproteobacteria bacterium]MBU2380432.1 energy transducer TonB [Alphaproteobacteria bacterium]
MRPLRLLATLTALSLAASATAQDADWEVIDRGSTVAAAVSFDSGIAVVVRCDDESLETYIVGLATVPDKDDPDRRTIQYAFGDRPLRASTWQVSENGQTLFADLPAPLARRFRQGGDLQLQLAGEESAPPRRYIVSLPPSRAAIDQVLSACGRPAIDPRDELRRSESSATLSQALPQGPSWARLPRPIYPNRALRDGLSGMAVLSCLTLDDGGLEDCRIEVERPAGKGFGPAAVRAAENAQLRSDEPYQHVLDSGLVNFTVRFSLH